MSAVPSLISLAHCVFWAGFSVHDAGHVGFREPRWEFGVAYKFDNVVSQLFNVEKWGRASEADNSPSWLLSHFNNFTEERYHRCTADAAESAGLEAGAKYLHSIAANNV